MSSREFHVSRSRAQAGTPAGEVIAALDLLARLLIPDARAQISSGLAGQGPDAAQA